MAYLFFAIVVGIILFVVKSVMNSKHEESETIFISKSGVETQDTETSNHAIDIIPYDKYDEYLNSINPDTLDLSSVELKQLNCVEKAFLRYLNGRSTKNLSIARNWYYTYGIDVKYEITLFLKTGLITVENHPTLDNFTIPELKEILSNKNVPKSGRKAELIKRIHDNFSNEEIVALTKNKISYYILTEDGEKLIKELPRSATYNIDLEDRCIDFILKENYNEAYKEVCSFRSSSPMPSGLGFDWKTASLRGWNGAVLDKTTEDSKIYSACSIFCSMMGIKYAAANALYKRLTGKEYTITTEQKENMPVESYRFYTSNKRELDSYKELGIKKYKILSACDNRTCEKCLSMNNKIYDTSEAVIGITAPPFEYDCRCTTVAVLED